MDPLGTKPATVEWKEPFRSISGVLLGGTFTLLLILGFE